MRTGRTAVAMGLAAVLLFVGACGSATSATGTPSLDGTPQSSIETEPSIAAPETSVPPNLPTAGPLSTLPPGALTIATIGDSLTEGQGDDSGLGGYPGRLKTLIDPIRPGTKIVNVGHSGWSSTDLINGQNGQPAELAQAMDARPNVALVWIGSNDLWNLYEFGPEPMTADAEQADLAAYAANIDTILKTLTGRGTTVFIALLDDQSKRPVAANPPNPAEPAFPATTKADLALMSAHVRAYNDAIRRAAAKHGATTVDFFNTTIFTDAATLYGDGNHPNSAGYDRVAQIWFAALQARLK